MATSQSRLDILIAAKNTSSAAINKVSQDVRGIDRAAGEASKGLDSLFAVAGVAGFAALVSNAANATFELGELGAQSLMVGDSFDDTAMRLESSSGDMLDAMKRASRGMIDEQSLMLGANRAMILGVADNMDEMGALLEVAGARAKIMGMDVATAYNDLVTGIGRMSPLVLDNLGIVTGGQKVFDDYAASIGVSADELTDAERKQALLNMAIRDTIPYMEGAKEGTDATVEGFQQWQAATTDLRNELGELIAMGLGPQLGKVAGVLGDIAKVISIIRTGQTFTGYGALGLAEMFSDTEQTSYAQEVLAQSADEASRSIDRQGASVDDLTKAYDSANRSIASMAAGQLGNLGASGALAMQQNLTAELGAQARIWQDMQIDPKQIAEVLIPGWLDGQRELTRETTATGRAVSQVSAEYNELLGKAKSVLSGSLNAGVSADGILEKMGLRPDAINEDARRLADVAIKGFDSPWADYFRTAHPGLFDDMFFGDIRAVAAQQLKDFEDGLNPELIDRGRAKERIRRMIVGDQNMAAMASELAAELSSELGVPLQQALQAAQGGLGVDGGMLGVGVDSAQGFTDGATAGLDETNAGASFVDRYVGQMRGNFSLLRTAGADAAKEWSTSFYNHAAENLSPQLISLLATLITPSVMAQFHQQGTLEGATP